MKKLYRSKKNKKLSGLCGGIAEAYGWDPSIIRILYALAFVFNRIFSIRFGLHCCVACRAGFF